MMVYLIFVLSLVSVFLFVYEILCLLTKNRRIVGIRLEKIAEADLKEESELNRPLFTRVFKPVLEGISRMILKVTPKEIVSSYEKKIIMAGNPFNLSVKGWINIQAAAVLCLPLLTVVAGYYKNTGAGTLLFLSAIEIGTAFILPNFILSTKITERQRKIINSLPDIIDLLTVSVEAGLGFDGALAKVVDKMPGPLSDEFERVLQAIKVGKQKKDALKEMTERVCVSDLTTFVGSIIQADQFGVSIGSVLRIQSEQMRQKRRQRAQEKAMKAPVKMLIPMVLFILPTIFSVLMGPVIIRMISIFKK